MNHITSSIASARVFFLVAILMSAALDFFGHDWASAPFLQLAVSAFLGVLAVMVAKASHVV